MTLFLSSGPPPGKLVAELTGVSKSFGDRVVVRDLDLLEYYKQSAAILRSHQQRNLAIEELLLEKLVPRQAVESNPQR